MGIWHILGMFIALFLILSASLYSGHSVKNTQDFNSGGKQANVAVVSGAIMGTLVGGSSTIGTAQMAYTFGLSAWWFTLGGGIACVVLALIFTKPLRNKSCTTILEVISNEYGKPVGIAASVLSSIGTFISIISQLISASAVIAIVLPRLNLSYALISAAVLMVLYVIFGGVQGVGIVGIVKLLLLYISVITGSILVLCLNSGVRPFWEQLDHSTYFNLFARGVGVDIGAGVSLLFGVLSTQSYAQAILAGRTDTVAKRGALISACLTPPIGIGGIFIGLYMRTHFPELSSAKLVFPQFVLDHMPPLLAGVVLATLLIAVIGTGSGLALGISTVINRDIIRPLTHGKLSPARDLYLSRGLIILILTLACVLCMGPIGDTILNFSFMSMGLRGTVIIVPLCCALWLQGKVSRKWVMFAIIFSPTIVLLLTLWGRIPFDPLFLGVGTSAALCAVGYFRKHAAGLDKPAK